MSAVLCCLLKWIFYVGPRSPAVMAVMHLCKWQTSKPLMTCQVYTWYTTTWQSYFALCWGQWPAQALHIQYLISKPIHTQQKHMIHYLCQYELLLTCACRGNSQQVLGIQLGYSADLHRYQWWINLETGLVHESPSRINLKGRLLRISNLKYFFPGISNHLLLLAHQNQA